MDTVLSVRLPRYSNWRVLADSETKEKKYFKKKKKNGNGEKRERERERTLGPSSYIN